MSQISEAIAVQRLLALAKRTDQPHDDSGALGDASADAAKVAAAVRTRLDMGDKKAKGKVVLTFECEGQKMGREPMLTWTVRVSHDAPSLHPRREMTCYVHRDGTMHTVPEQSEMDFGLAAVPRADDDNQEAQRAKKGTV